jgi:hypothetical protein
MRCSMFTNATWHNTANISELADEWRINNHLGRTKPTRATVSPAFHTQTRQEATKFENTERPRVRQIISIDYRNGEHTYLSVC